MKAAQNTKHPQLSDKSLPSISSYIQPGLFQALPNPNKTCLLARSLQNSNKGVSKYVSPATSLYDNPNTNLPGLLDRPGKDRRGLAGQAYKPCCALAMRDIRAVSRPVCAGLLLSSG